MRAFGPEDFVKATGVSRETRARLETYADLLRHWQTRINLVAETTLPDLWRRHVLDSYQLVPLIPPGTRRIADLGSGAGFPGLILALTADPALELRVELFESDQRKAAFLQEVIRRTGAWAKVTIARIETTPEISAEVLTARALAPLPKLLTLIERHWRPAMTGLFLKGRGLESEIQACSGVWNLHYDLVPSMTDSAATIFVLRSLSRV